MTECLEDCNGGARDYREARDWLGWWEQPPSISDESWAQLLALASPDLSPDCPTAKDGRRRAELALRVFLPHHYPEPFSSTSSLLEKGACDGRRFLAALEDAFFMIAVSGRDELKTASLTKTTRNILNLISFLEVLAAITGQVERVNPRTKSAQHLAVKLIREVWIDLKMGEEGRKKDFVEFAYRCLAFARAGVTRNSVVESWDRHLQPLLRDEEEEEEGT